MALTTMYEGKNNSPQTDITAAITSADTVISVTDVSVFPTAPNLATIGNDENAEVIRYNGISGSTLTGCERGFGGTTASPWDASTVISRQITKHDLDTLRENILDLDDRKIEFDHGAYYVVGTQTATTASWTGNLPDVDALYNGLAIDYWLPYKGASNVTLNLTLKGGTTTGAINCYFSGTTRLSTQIEANNLCHLVYQTVTISGTSYTGWWLIKDYYLNDSAYKLYRAGGNLIANSVLYRYQLLFTISETTVTPLNNDNNNTGTNKTMLTNVEFDPHGEIFFWDSTSTISAGATISNTSRWSATADLRYTFNCGQTLTPNEPLYLKVSPQSNGKVKLPSDATTVVPLTQALPSTNDGFLYIYLGRTTSAYQMDLYPWHHVYYHDGTSIKEYVRPHVHDDRYYTESEINTKFGKEILYFYNQSTSVTSTASSEFCRVTDSRIDADTVVLNCEFTVPSAITSPVSWTSTNGSISLKGICTSSNCKVNLVLGQKGN